MPKGLVGRKGRPVGHRSPTQHGYIKVKVGKGDWRYEHRLVAGTSGDLVTHHRNGDTWDNRAENLEVMTKQAHSAMHGQTGRWARKFDACIACGTQVKRHLSKGLCTTCYQRKPAYAE